MGALNPARLQYFQQRYEDTKQMCIEVYILSLSLSLSLSPPFLLVYIYIYLIYIYKRPVLAIDDMMYINPLCCGGVLITCMLYIYIEREALRPR